MTCVVCEPTEESITKLAKNKKTANNSNAKKRPDELALEMDTRHHKKPKEEDTIR